MVSRRSLREERSSTNGIDGASSHRRWSPDSDGGFETVACPTSSTNDRLRNLLNRGIASSSTDGGFETVACPTSSTNDRLRELLNQRRDREVLNQRAAGLGGVGVWKGGRMVGPTGEQFEIAAGGYRAVVTESGATLRAARARAAAPLLRRLRRGRDAVGRPRPAADAVAQPDPRRRATPSAAATSSSALTEPARRQRLARAGPLGGLDAWRSTPATRCRWSTG